MGWLEEHIETFVNPHLAEVGHPEFNYRDPRQQYFTSEEMTVIKNSWRSVKRAANGKQILLPGRDVFIFEILARRENYPTVFVPECSRMTVRHLVGKLDPELFLFDTGFAGSIPRNLKTKSFGLLSSSENIFFTTPGYPNRGGSTTQIFPRLTWSRGLALKIEQTPKYWQSGRLAQADGGRLQKIVQPMSHAHEFVLAAQLTVEVYTNSSPRFVNSHKPMINSGGETW